MHYLGKSTVWLTGKQSQKRGTKLSDETKKKISVTLTGRKLSKETVAKMMKKRKPLRDYNEIIKAYISGMSIANIIVAFNCSIPTIYKALAKNNIKKRLSNGSE